MLPLLVAGCPPTRECLAPRDEHEALTRVNDNLARIDKPLQYNAVTSFRFRDADGRDRRFLWHEASLLFSTPRSLLFDIRTLAGVVAQFGSNDDRYWLWVDPEVHKLWWGNWDTLERGAPCDLAVPPDDLLDALMLRPLPAALAGGLNPLLRKVNGDHRLLFIRLSQDGQTAGMREILLDPCEPYQPLEIIDRLPDGRVQMHAYLEDYRRMGDDGPYTARKYVVYWPLDETEMRLDVARARFRPDLQVEDVFEFPYGWDGEMEQIDAPLSPGWSEPTEEGTIQQ